MPPNVTVTLRGRRQQQHASLGHLTKVMQTLNNVGEPSLSASPPPAVKPEPGTAQDVRGPSGLHLQRQLSGGRGPPQKRRRPSTPPQERPLRRDHDRESHEQLAHPPAPPPRGAGNAAPAEAAAAQPHNKRRRPEDAAEPAAQEPRKLRRKGDIPERLAAILANERSPSNSDVRLIDNASVDTVHAD